MLELFRSDIADEEMYVLCRILIRTRQHWRPVGHEDGLAVQAGQSTSGAKPDIKRFFAGMEHRIKRLFAGNKPDIKRLFAGMEHRIKRLSAGNEPDSKRLFAGAGR